MKRWVWFALVISILMGGFWYFRPSVDSCNIAYISLHGYLSTYIQEVGDDMTSPAFDQTASEDVVASIRQADADPSIKAIILEIDSGGGSPVAGEEIQAALKASEKPTLALIRELGDSSAYLAASGASIIFASVFSDVGGIGVTQSYLDHADQNKLNGLTLNQLSVGQYKDMFNPDKPLTPDERLLALNGLQVAYDHFVTLVAENRHLALNTGYELADGRSYTGREALQNGLIDRIGNDADAEAYLTEMIGLRRITACDY